MSEHVLAEQISAQIPLSHSSLQLLNESLMTMGSCDRSFQIILFYQHVYPKHSTVEKTIQRLDELKNDLATSIRRLESKIEFIEQTIDLLNDKSGQDLLEPRLNKTLRSAFAPGRPITPPVYAYDPGRLGKKNLPYRRVRYTVFIEGDTVQVFNTHIDAMPYRYCRAFINHFRDLTNRMPQNIKVKELPYQLAGNTTTTWVYDSHYTHFIRSYKNTYREILTYQKTTLGWKIAVTHQRPGQKPPDQPGNAAL